MSPGQPARGTSAPSVVPHPQRHDWFAIPRQWLPEVAAMPQTQLDSKWGPIVHRSHLPLLVGAHPEVAPFLTAARSRMGLDDDRIRDRAAFDATTEPNGWKLRDYQHDGREFILGRRGTLLADGMRVGKTGQCTAAHDPSSGPMLVVGPLAVREVWMAWFKRRWPDIRPTVLKGRHVEKLNPKKPTKPRRDRGFDVLDGERFSPQALKDAKLIFCNYDILGAWKEFGGRQIGTLVLDEIHLVSDRTSKRARAVEYIAAPANAHRVIAVSGTPIWNQPSGLYTTLASTCHIAFGRFFDYASRYCNLRPGSHGYLYDGSSNEAEFRERLSEVMIRRTWQDVSGQMPTIERTVEVVDITEAQTFEVEKQAERVRDHARMSTSVGALARFRRLLAKLKMPAAIDAAHRVLLSGEKVIVWTWHRDVALEIEDALAKKDFPGFVVAGATSMDMREDIINRWRAHPSPVPLVIALLVGQVGIDLTAAAHEVFAEIDFTPAVIAQAEMRPVTPLRPTFATYVIIDHEIERKILAALSDKCDTAFRVGVPAAESTVGVLAAAFSAAADGPNDFSALAAAIMSDHPDMDDIDGGDGSNFHGSLWTHDWET